MYVITEFFYAGEVRSVVRLGDAFIPLDPDNSEYQKYLEWAKTNTAEVIPYVEASVERRLLPLEVLELFTEAEQLAVVTATMSVPAVKLWYDKLLAASYVTLADPRTEGGLDSLVGAGLLTPARKAEIVAAMS